MNNIKLRKDVRSDSVIIQLCTGDVLISYGIIETLLDRWGDSSVLELVIRDMGVDVWFDESGENLNCFDSSDRGFSWSKVEVENNLKVASGNNFELSVPFY